MKRIKTAIIGAGFMGRTHAEACRRIESIQLAGVFDIDNKRASALAADFDIPVFSSLDDVCDSSEIEAVVVCTNDEYHVEPAVRCLGAGKHVLLEKPIATTLEDADAIIAAEKSAQGILLVGHVLRFEPRYERAKRVVASGGIGEIASIFARRLNAASSQTRLRGRVSVLSFLGVHDFDICNWIADSEPTRVFCETRRGFHTSQGFDVEDQAFSVVHYRNGAIACVESGWLIVDSHPRRGDFSLEVVGTKGTINLDLMSQGMAVSDAEGYRYESFGHGEENELTHFVDCARGDAVPIVDGAAARAALELSLGAQQSAANSSVVQLPL